MNKTVLIAFIAGIVGLTVASCAIWHDMNTMDRLCQEACFSQHGSSMAYRDMNGTCWCKLDENK